MKNYFNAQERNRHIVMMAMEGTAEEFLDSSALTEEELTSIRLACKHIKNFNTSIMKRFGQAYAHAVYGTLDANKLVFVSKALPTGKAVGYCDEKSLKPMLKDLQLFNCMDCEKEEHIKCPMYNMMIACGVDATCDNGCPFKM